MFIKLDKNNQVEWIDNDTISTLNHNSNSLVTLRIYKNKEIVFEKEYKNFSVAKAQETKQIKKFYR